MQVRTDIVCRVPLDCVFDSIEDLRFLKVYEAFGRTLSNEIIRHLIGPIDFVCSRLRNDLDNMQ